VIIAERLLLGRPAVGILAAGTGASGEQYEARQG
jgi:hypothetical protein